MGQLGTRAVCSASIYTPSDPDSSKSPCFPSKDIFKSEGVSDDFSHYPIIFVGDKAYSGFNEEIKQKILNQIF